MKKSFHAEGQAKEVLGGINLEIKEGEFVTIFGPNGCGKTTLLSILAGLEKPDSGSIEGINIKHSEVGYVFQDYKRSLLPWKNGEQNICFPLELAGVSAEERKLALANLLALTGLNLDLQQRVYTLSGGQAQLMCILRALIIKPKLLVLDEPFSALDFERTLLMRQVIQDLAAKLSLTVLFISHDLEEALYLGDKVVFLRRGPSQVESILEVPFSRPREASLIASSEFANLKLAALERFQRCCEES